MRPTVFGAMDGLVSNASLIIGVGGGGVSAHAIVLTGLAGLAAGSFSMAAGEYISVTSQNELVQAEVALERDMHARYPVAERDELAQTLARYGLDPELAARAAVEISAHPRTALRLHTREELGVDAEALPSAWTAAGASLVSFAAGAVLPLLPYLLGARTLTVSLILFVVALFAGGAIVAQLTGRPRYLGGGRQLLLGVVAAAVTFGIGHLIGTSTG